MDYNPFVTLFFCIFYQIVINWARFVTENRKKKLLILRKIAKVNFSKWSDCRSLSAKNTPKKAIAAQESVSDRIYNPCGNFTHRLWHRI